MAGIVQAAGCLASAGASLRGVQVNQQQQRNQGVRRCSTVRVRAETTEASSVALNPGIKKDSDKVVDTVVVGELAKPLTAYCRYIILLFPCSCTSSSFLCSFSVWKPDPCVCFRCDVFLRNISISYSPASLLCLGNNSFSGDLTNITFATGPLGLVCFR